MKTLSSNRVDREVWNFPVGGEGAVRGCVLLLDQEGEIILRMTGDGRFEADGIRLHVRCESLSHGSRVEMDLVLESRRHIQFIGVELELGHLAESRKFFGTTPGFLEKQGVTSAVTAQNEGRVASMMGVISDPEGFSLLAGIDVPSSEPSVFYLRSGRFRAGFSPDREIEGLFQFRLCILTEKDPLVLLRNYGRRLAALRRSDDVLVPTGWNSWDFYGGAVSMADLDAEMVALEELGCRSDISYLTLDMGWEELWGSWIPNRKFPKSLADVAGRIRSRGWRPGIWTAPLQVSMYSELARHRQELFLHDGNGALIVDVNGPCGPVLLLDFSLSEVQGLVGAWFSSMREAGFELFKIDYLYEDYVKQALNNDGGLGKVAFVRRVFEIIRAAVGSEAHIINCGGSKEGALGIVDSCRVTVDIHNFWGHIRNNARQLAHSFWLNRNCWVNDPDFAIVRNANNCTATYKNMPYSRRAEASPDAVSPAEFWMSGAEASASEMRLWLSAVRLNGGSIFLSDSLRFLNQDGRGDLERLFPPLEASFTPLDLFEREWPGVWLSMDQKRPTLGLFNWEDGPRSLEIPAILGGSVSGRDFWSGNKVGLSGAVDLDARAGLLIEI